METNAKKSAVVATSIDNDILTVTCNGEEFVVNPADLSAELQTQAMLHGLKQKLIDAAAIGRNPDTGKSATPDDKADAVRIVHERLTSGGTWNAERGTGAPTSSLLVRALMEHFKKDRSVILAFLDNKTKEEKAALRIHPPIAAIINRMQSEVKTDIDTSALLAELNG